MIQEATSLPFMTLCYCTTKSMMEVSLNSVRDRRLWKIRGAVSSSFARFRQDTDVISQHDLGDRNDNIDMCIDFRNSNHLVIGQNLPQGLLSLN